jgi:ABC-2 type transport system permease protein
VNRTIAAYAFKTWFRVRGSFAGPLVFLSLMFLVEGSFWTALGGRAGRIAAYSRPQMLLYIFGALIISQVSACIGEPDGLAEKIESGSLDGFLLRPQSYLVQMGSIQTGLCLARMTVLAPILIACEWALTGRVSWSAQAALLVLLPFAAALNFLINQSLLTLTFYYRDSYALVVFKETLFWALSGMMIPLDLFPGPIARAARLLPSAYIVYYPAKVLSGELSWTAVILPQLAYLAFFFAVAWWIWAAGVKRYQAYGG